MLFMGMLLDDGSCMLIAAPLLYPIFMKLGIDPLQMAAILSVNQGSGQMTPQVATNLIIASRVARLPVKYFFNNCVPFLIFGSLPIVLITTFIPQVSLWLPNIVMGH